jgi:hypothetical protein
MRVLVLIEKEPVRSAQHLKAEEVVKRAKVLDGELSAKTISELSKKSIATCCQDDVVNIEQQISSIKALSIDEQGGIGARRAEDKLMTKRHHALVRGAWCLLQPIQGAREQAHTVGMLGVNKPSGLLTVHLFREMSMKEGVGDVHLWHRSSSRNTEVHNSLDRARFDNRSKRIREVDAGVLRKPQTTERSL